jgi:hypothetical protein
MQSYHAVAIRADQQDRLGELAVGDIKVGKHCPALRAVNRLVIRSHNRHKIFRGTILRLNLWTGEGASIDGIIPTKGLKLALANRADGRAVSGCDPHVMATSGE